MQHSLYIIFVFLFLFFYFDKLIFCFSKEHMHAHSHMHARSHTHMCIGYLKLFTIFQTLIRIYESILQIECTCHFWVHVESDNLGYYSFLCFANNLPITLVIQLIVGMPIKYKGGSKLVNKCIIFFLINYLFALLEARD